MPQEVEGLSGRALEQTDGLVCAVLTPPAPRGLSRLLALCSPGTYSSREHLPLPGAPTARGDWEQERSQFIYGSENNA